MASISAISAPHITQATKSMAKLTSQSYDDLQPAVYFQGWIEPFKDRLSTNRCLTSLTTVKAAWVNLSTNSYLPELLVTKCVLTAIAGVIVQSIPCCCVCESQFKLHVYIKVHIV